MAALEEFAPDILASHGSFLEELIVHLHATGARFRRPRLLLGRGCDVARRSAARATAFGIPSLSIYGAYEAPDLGFECPQHAGYHVNCDLYPFRVLDAGGGVLAPGDPGEIVVSNLVNRGTVLLNYRLGDEVSAVPEACRCGRTLPRALGLAGRPGVPGPGGLRRLHGARAARHRAGHRGAARALA